MIKKDLSGLRFERLLVISRSTSDYKYWLCKCDCGKEKYIRGDHLRKRRTLSCGCLGKENRLKKVYKHGLSYNPLYFVWASMMDRCYNTSFQDYRNYGGRGISVCDRWHKVEDFVSDMTKGYSKGLQLDRIDNDGNYSPSNCRWVTRKQNNRNKRTSVYLTVGSETKTIIEWSEITGIFPDIIRIRIKKGWKGEKALYGPVFLSKQRKINV